MVTPEPKGVLKAGNGSDGGISFVTVAVVLGVAAVGATGGAVSVVSTAVGFVRRVGVLGSDFAGAGLLNVFFIGWF